MGLQAVLIVRENRRFLTQQKSEREGADENSKPALPRGASSLDHYLILPQDTGEEVTAPRVLRAGKQPLAIT